MKLSSLLLVVALSAATAFGVTKYAATPTGPAAEAKKETAFERVMRTGTLKCGYVIYPGFIDRDPNTGKLSGRYYDFVEEVGKQIGVKIDWAEEVAISSGLEGLKTSRFDAMCVPYNAAPTRARIANFTAPVIHVPSFLYVRADDTRFDNNYKALNNPDIKFAQLDGEAGEILRRQSFPQSSVLALPSITDYSQILVNVELKKADVAIADAPVAETYIAQNPGKLKRVAGPPVYMQAGGMSVTIGEEELKSLLNTTIFALSNSDFLDKTFIRNEIDRNTIFLPEKTWRQSKE
jgi:ABC-type amino acid transport substrate-binding protein